VYTQGGGRPSEPERSEMASIHQRTEFRIGDYAQGRGITAARLIGERRRRTRGTKPIATGNPGGPPPSNVAVQRPPEWQWPDHCTGNPSPIPYSQPCPTADRLGSGAGESSASHRPGACRLEDLDGAASQLRVAPGTHSRPGVPLGGFPGTEHGRISSLGAFPVARGKTMGAPALTTGPRRNLERPPQASASRPYPSRSARASSVGTKAATSGSWRTNRFAADENAPGGKKPLLRLGRAQCTGRSATAPTRRQATGTGQLAVPQIREKPIQQHRMSSSGPRGQRADACAGSHNPGRKTAGERPLDAAQHPATTPIRGPPNATQVRGTTTARRHRRETPLSATGSTVSRSRWANEIYNGYIASYASYQSGGGPTTGKGKHKTKKKKKKKQGGGGF